MFQEFIFEKLLAAPDDFCSWSWACLAHRNRSDFCDLQLRCPSPTPEIASDVQDMATQCCIVVQGCDGKSLAICDFELRILSPKPHAISSIFGDLGPSTRKSLAIAMVRLWCAKSWGYDRDGDTLVDLGIRTSAHGSLLQAEVLQANRIGGLLQVGMTMPHFCKAKRSQVWGRGCSLRCPNCQGFQIQPASELKSRWFEPLGDRHDWTTRGPNDGNEWGSAASYLAYTPCVPLLMLVGKDLETKGLLDFFIGAWHRFRRTANSSPVTFGVESLRFFSCDFYRLFRSDFGVAISLALCNLGAYKDALKQKSRETLFTERLGGRFGYFLRFLLFGGRGKGGGVRSRWGFYWKERRGSLSGEMGAGHTWPRRMSPRGV